MMINALIIKCLDMEWFNYDDDGYWQSIMNYYANDYDDYDEDADDYDDDGNDY